MPPGWYRQDELPGKITQLRDTSTSGTPGLPAVEGAIVDSLRQQLRAYRGRIARPRLENQALREQVAHHLGAQPDFGQCRQIDKCVRL
ncbi:hypothetical protein [Segeticoccus rhizosphaerae]|uniref:hypothetical protein n=1 Tax=Segeticoccus rhizosphaerae TaxID=1104777 RepID=UPI0010BFD30A|nr:hypothetical protein [Ornithinicoccus soli]